MHRLVRLCFAFLLSCSLPALAEEKDIRLSGWQLAGGVLLTELGVGFNAYLASRDPHAYGVFIAIFGPLGALTGGSGGYPVTRVAGAVGAVGLGAYNIWEIDEDKMTRSEIFKKNFAAWHVMAAAAGLVGLLGGDYRHNDTRASLSVVPYGTRSEPMITFSYRFR